MFVVSAVLIAAVVVAGAVASSVLLRPERVVRRQVRRRCLVACKDGQSFSGVLTSADRTCLILRDAQIVGDGGAAAVDGEALIFRADVAFVQFP